ncbi:MAG: hypothetical protein K5686_00445 [Lachnospiraceae bacterium]|nr:hypothetical protein [Lachnospiraceae bacterium]
MIRAKISHEWRGMGISKALRQTSADGAERIVHRMFSVHFVSYVAGRSLCVIIAIRKMKGSDA